MYVFATLFLTAAIIFLVRAIKRPNSLFSGLATCFVGL